MNEYNKTLNTVTSRFESLFSGNKEKFAIVMGIRTPGDYMDENMIASLLSINCELTMLHNIKPMFKPKARALLIQQQRMATSTSFSADVVNGSSDDIEFKALFA